MIFQPSLASGIELKKVNKSINTGKVSFGFILTLFSSRENYITVVLLHFKINGVSNKFYLWLLTKHNLVLLRTLTNNNNKLYCQVYKLTGDMNRVSLMIKVCDMHLIPKSIIFYKWSIDRKSRRV